MDAGAQRFDHALPAVPASVPRLRGQLTSWVQSLGLPDEQVNAVRLVVTEAVTNAVIHAYVGREPGMVRVTAEPAHDQLVIRVVDDGCGIGPRHDSPGLGMGLPMIGKLAARVDLAAGPGDTGTEVRIAFDAPGLVGPAAEADDVLSGVLDALGRLGGDGTFDGRDIAVLADLLVPQLVDLCSITLLDADGKVRRVGARVATPDGAIDDAAREWVLQFPATAASAPSYLAAVEGKTHVVDVDPAWIADVSPDPVNAERLQGLDLAWWAAVPLVAGGQLVGSVSVASRDARGNREPVIAMVERAAARAGGLVATARLVDDLRRTRRRFERILGALVEAVTVADQDGRIVYANPAAALLLGAEDVDEVMRTSSAELSGRFDIVGEDGRPVPDGALPYRRALAGETVEPLITRSTHRATGRVRWLRTTATLLDDEGPLVVSVVQDITALRQAQHGDG